MSFLPKNYEIPKTESNYLSKFEDGENRFRVLSDAAVGWLYWQDAKGNVLAKPTKGCKTIHVKNPQDVTEDVSQNPDVSPKHFWAFVVWNYAEERVQILKLTQSSIMKDIGRYVENPEWGDPKAYDIIVYKKGEGLKTEYQVAVSPKKLLDEGISQLYRDMEIDLQALFRGEDPFKAAENGAAAPKQ